MINTKVETVRFVETDILGVVHHSNYFRWFEIGRVAYLADVGINILELMDEGVLFLIKEVSCKYLLPARFGDEVIIETELSTLTQAQMVFQYRLINKKTQKLLSTGETQLVPANMNGKICRLPMNHYEKLKAVYNKK